MSYCKYIALYKRAACLRWVEICTLKYISYNTHLRENSLNELHYHTIPYWCEFFKSDFTILF